MKKKLFFVFLTIMLAVTFSFASGAADSGVLVSSDGAFAYIKGSDGVTVTEYRGSEESLEISQIDGFDVISIASGAFTGNKTLKEITLPQTLQTAEDFAFYGCEALEKVTFKGKNSNIGAYAFRSCSALESVELPANLSCVSDGAFYGCKNLSKLALPETLTEIDARFKNKAKE